MTHLSKTWTGPSTGDPKPIIYLSGIVAGGNVEKALRSRPDIVRYQCVSYFYLGTRAPERNTELFGVFHEHGTRCFLDSGAFSYQIQAIKKKCPLDKKAAAGIIDQYVDWVYACPYVFDFIVSFDYERDATVEAWATKRIESRGLHPVPVYHLGSPLSVLRGMIDSGYTFIAIGGMVGSPNAQLHPFLDQVFNITTPRNIRLHGFGIGSAVTMFKYPWFCVDSTTWLAAAGKGGQVVRRSVDPRKIVEVVNVSPRSTAICHTLGDNREARIVETWQTYQSLMTDPPRQALSKKGLF